jgi:hypothetical protein
MIALRSIPMIVRLLDEIVRNPGQMSGRSVLSEPHLMDESAVAHA